MKSLIEKDFNIWLNFRNALEWTPYGKTEPEKIRSIPLSEAVAVWDLIKRECGEKISTKDIDARWIRMSVEHISSSLYQDFTFGMGELILRCRCGVADFLGWKESALGKTVYRLGNRITDEQALQQYGAGVKMLSEKMVREGSLKASEILFQSIGKRDGTPTAVNQPVVEWVKNYKIEADGKVTETSKEIKITQQVLPEDATAFKQILLDKNTGIKPNE